MGTISDKLGTDIIAAMKAKEADKLTTLRLVKSSLKSKEIDKREPLTDAEEQAALTTMLKQRRESIEQFTKGNRPELAAKEQVEITLIEAYLPQAVGEDEIRRIVETVVQHMTADGNGVRPAQKDMGAVIAVVKQRLMAGGTRADGKIVSDLVRTELTKS